MNRLSLEVVNYVCSFISLGSDGFMSLMLTAMKTQRLCVLRRSLDLTTD